MSLSPVAQALYDVINNETEGVDTWGLPDEFWEKFAVAARSAVNAETAELQRRTSFPKSGWGR